MAAHSEILAAAIATCRRRASWRFRPLDIVRALPHLHPGTVRTHVVSRCCVNAPKNHPHKWDYFERVGRGLYEVRRPFRSRGASRRVLAEPRVSYAPGSDPLRETIHVVVRRSSGWYVAECLEVAVVTQDRTLDGLLHQLQEAVALHLEGEDPRALGLTRTPRVSMTYELPPIST
jgi:hypothetical protein